MNRRESSGGATRPPAAAPRPPPLVRADGQEGDDGLPSARTCCFHRDAAERVTEITDPAGKALKYVYAANSDLSRVEDRTGAAMTFEYATSPEHLLTDDTDARGVRVARNTHDADGRLVSTTDANGQTIVFEHDVSAQREVVRDRLGNPTTYEYDDRGNVTRTTDALGHTKEATYDAFDNTLTETDAFGRVTTHSYDLSFNRTSTTNALGQTRTTTYDQFGAALTVTDELGPGGDPRVRSPHPVFPRRASAHKLPPWTSRTRRRARTCPPLRFGRPRMSTDVGGQWIRPFVTENC